MNSGHHIANFEYKLSPEPGTVAPLALGLCGVIAARNRAPSTPCASVQ
ncbi:MAG: PEP-CTERM sorting domain-containing protein [Deltaproteobacteria bacterium]|nr:PEP-CTERM sorting domain-containing protein [Deltaproteobacteria bacterium]MBW2390386.1 PEP-CTERM sorting domain-containing protein [Deltaproteobacteria bacterium]MBW2724682.1 PEP-CTERM sorting domain-containing protein [Deltaproteobacteria bacterium]